MTNASDAQSALAHVRHVRVGTKNPPKLSAVRAAIEAYSTAATVEGVAVESGVPEQPVGFDEIVAGARERARAAFESGRCDLAVGIEDGLIFVPALGDDAVNVGAAAVTDGKRCSVGLSSGFAYPPGCSARAVSEREPIGDLFDALMTEVEGDTVTEPSRLGQGNVGRLTLGVLNRDEYGRHAVVCALVRFLHPLLYASDDPVGAAPPVESEGAYRA